MAGQAAMSSGQGAPEEPTQEPGLQPDERTGSFLGKEDTGSTLAVGHAVLIFLVVAAPNAVLLVGLSGIGRGLQVFNKMAPHSLYGDFCFVAAAASAALFYICNWPNWRRGLQFVSIMLPWILGCVGTLFKSRKYPYGPIIMCVFLIVFLIGLLRAGPCKKSKRVYFYRVTYLSTCLFGILLGSLWGGWVVGGSKWSNQLKEDWAGQSQEIYDNVWSERALNYTVDCGPNRVISASMASETRVEMKTACSAAERVLFMVWASPFAGAVCNLVVSTFLFLNGVAAKFDDKLLDRDLKRFVLFLTVLVTGMYASAYAAGTSMRLGSTLMAFFLSGIVALSGWVLLEVGPEVISQTVVKSKFAGMAQKAASSDWVKAMCIGAVNVLLPICYCLEKARQTMARTCGAKRSRGSKYEPGSRGGSRDLVTEHFDQLMVTLSAFNWASILLKICILGELFFLFQVGVAKATYVFLSWMNEELYVRQVSFGLIVGVVALVGVCMFLLPPVPGVPVYVFTGVVLGAQGERVESLGFWGCTIVAICVAWILKLVACTLQYMIGYTLGKSVKVQQLIGVDKVVTRAIQMILERKGLDPGKVAVLVGGPDWPVSVTCGILRLNVPQMLLGTAPVIVALAPCVLAGAFLMKVEAGVESSIWSVLSSVCMTAMVVIQSSSMFMAVYLATGVVDKHYDELAKPREEHRQVEELTKREEAYNQAYKQATDWGKLHIFRKILLLSTTAMMLLQGFMFAFFDELCFENFAVNGKISAPLDENGLGNNAWNIVKSPFGYFGIGLFFAASVLHFVIVKDLQCLAKREHASMLQTTGGEKVTPQILGAPLS